MGYDSGRLEAIEAEAKFLCDRLSAFELTNDHEEMARQFMGHVEPSLERLKVILNTHNQEGQADG